MQRSGSGKGKGVVCVVEADFLTTNHNKQGFAQDKRYATFINALGNKLNEYWEVKVGNGISGTFARFQALVCIE